MNRDIKSNPLSYQDRLVRRSSQDIDSIVVHCTELPNLHLARRFGERIHHQESQTGNSGHFYIEKDGSIEQFIAPLFIANHVIGHNASSIGIELVNAGRYPNWFQSDSQTVVDPYPDQQIQALIDLIHYITDRYPFVQNIAGHEDLDKTMIASEDNSNLQIKRKLIRDRYFLGTVSWRPSICRESVGKTWATGFRLPVSGLQGEMCLIFELSRDWNP